MPPSAIALMLKSMLGVDADSIKTQFEDGMSLLKNTFAHFDERLTSIELRLSAIEFIIKTENTK